MHACVCSVVSDSANPWTVAHRLLFLWKSPGKNTGVGCHALLQGILPTQGSNPCLLHWQADSLPVSYQGSPKSFNGHLFKIKVKLNCRCILSSWKFSSVQFNLSVICDSPRPHGLQPTRLLCPWDFPGKSTGVGCHCLLQSQRKAMPKNAQTTAQLHSSHTLVK